ncbi:MAG: AAA family ATPase [Acidobacteria bacterium]|nr:AAA family ATPase [Acidobacteriota bacterium]MYH31185.1 AAA family ATPase [Acidobacteriota bacterium]
MYSSIQINGYRGLDSFRMEKLGRVNLLVGMNNSGKTSILECIELLRSAGDPHVVSSIARRRGELGYTGYRLSGTSFAIEHAPVNVAHLFPSHRLEGEIVVEAARPDGAAASGWNRRVAVCIEDPSGSDLDEPVEGVLEGDDDIERLLLRVKWSDAQDDYKALVTDEGLLYRSRRPVRPRNGSRQTVQFVRTSGMSASDVVRMFDKVVLTESEEAVTQALRILEPGVERIATVSNDRRAVSSELPGGVFLKFVDAPGRVPIGSMGDGMWRMLGLALSISIARGGVLLVDEIDTGLHYKVMEDMWRMIGERATALSVQVFATTHSRDCYESLGAAVESDVGDVTIQRIDRIRGKAVRIANKAVVAAAERNIEVR